MDITEVPTGHIVTENGLEFLSIGDYGKEANMFARFLGLNKKIEKVEHKDMLSLAEKWVITISTQYGCSMGCTFCDVPKVGPGVNIGYKELLYQVEAARQLHSEIVEGERLNIHFARMGEPTWNRDVLAAAYMLKQIYGKQFRTVHPVVSTMMPRHNKDLRLFIKAWLLLKNNYFQGEAGLQLSINSTKESVRDQIFNKNQMKLPEISEMMKDLIGLYDVVGRKITLNFALGNYEIDADCLRALFDPQYFLVKLTPMHITNAVIDNGVKWQQDPYPVEEALHAAGFDVIVFIPSEEEDKGRITCGNALLSGSKSEIPVKKKATKADHDSWAANPDRMGGQFTAEEIERSRSSW